MHTSKKREEAAGEIADRTTNEIMTNRKIRFKESSLVNGNSGGYELLVEADAASGARLKPIIEKHSLALREANGLFIIYKQH
jgi:hypothetical protein